MQAVVYTEYGSPDVLKLREVETPTAKDNEVRVKVHAVHVNYGDLAARNFKNIPASEFNMPSYLLLIARMEFGFNTPNKRILGNEFSGVIDAVGKDVTRFKIGDEVFGNLAATMGANAEYLCIAEDGLVSAKPHNMSFEEAACVPYGGLTALNLLKKGKIQRGQKVLIIGASGSIGQYALQLAKYYGAEVTAVCGTPRIEMMKALGADHVIDYTKEDVTQSGKHYDLVFDVLGRGSFSRIKRVLNEKGIYLLASFKTEKLLQMLWTSMFGSKKVICALSSESQGDLVLLKELIEKGAISTVVDRCFPLEQTAAAHRYAESGHQTGNIVIQVNGSQS